MKPITAVLAGVFLAYAADPAVVECPRAQADFELTANADAPHWRKAPGVKADVDPFGKPSPGKFEVRMQWTPRYLYMLFISPYDDLNLKADPKTAEETYQLWSWDVTELFIGADLEQIHRYREYQVSPQGEWVDLDIDRKSMNAEKAWQWNSGFQVKARIDKTRKIWYGEMKIPMASMDTRPAEVGKQYRMNLYRLTGKAPNRQSTMWTPVMDRSHHTPEKFGRLVLAK
ncbi:MAG: hypothetical protein FJW20_18000 [Acidimicrobiia bacterium]|nr:hypothetical protein [Acidimicrobiia bacterium]